MTNNVNFTLSAADKTAIDAAIVTLQTKLMPKLLALTDAERKTAYKMGDKSVAFVQKAITYGTQSSTQLPPYIDLVALGVDVNAVTVLTNYDSQLATLVRGVEDTLMMAGSEAIEASTDVYSAIKMAAQHNVTGAQEAYNDMKVRFPGRPAKSGTTPPAANP